MGGVQNASGRAQLRLEDGGDGKATLGRRSPRVSKTHAGHSIGLAPERRGQAWLDGRHGPVSPGRLRFRPFTTRPTETGSGDFSLYGTKKARTKELEALVQACHLAEVGTEPRTQSLFLQAALSPGFSRDDLGQDVRENNCFILIPLQTC